MEDKCRVIAITNQKGGVGKTTTSVNLSDYLAKFKKKTRIRITLPIYDTEFEISIDKDDIVKYEMAARLVTDRFNAYTVAYKGRKTEHEIALMTMLDLVLLRDKGL